MSTKTAYFKPVLEFEHPDHGYITPYTINLIRTFSFACSNLKFTVDKKKM